MPRPTLHIAQPCAEGWEAMTPTGPGRHCAACAKTVVDFTQQTDAEILAYFRQQGAGKTCGRFRVGQLGRPLRMAPPTPPRPARWQAWLASLLVAALATQSCQPTTRGEAPPLALAPTPAATLGPGAGAAAGDSVAVAGASAGGGRVIEGQVYDVASQRPVARATVQLQHTQATAISDASGHFAIQLPEDLPVPGAIRLRLAAPGYAPRLLAASSAQQPAHGLAIAHLSYPLPQMILGEVEELPTKIK